MIRTPGLDELPLLPRGRTLHQFSSHNKTGTNGDAGWFLYRDRAGDAVIFDAAGPGCIRSMWGTAIPESQTLRFTFDEEPEPRIVARTLDLYEGKHPLFPPPLASRMVTGRYEGPQSSSNSFVPLPFDKSLRIAVEGGVSFHHILYERFTIDERVTSFTGSEDNTGLIEAFTGPGEEAPPDPSSVEIVETASDGIPAEGVFDLHAAQGSGAIRRIVLETEGTEEFLQNVEIEGYWDGAVSPDVIAPVGMFFACPDHAENVRALPLKVERSEEGRLRLTAYWRMPFWREARLRLVNRAPRRTGPIRAVIHRSRRVYPEGGTGYFRTQYRIGRTVMGRDWPFFEAIGTGWFVGVVQTMRNGHYCEGDEHFTMDGARMPQIHGTGSEDYYLACFWPNRNFNLPFAGCVGDVFEEGGGYYAGSYRRRGCYYRFHLEAPVPFYSKIDARIQHGGASDIVSEYASLGFAYVRDRPALERTDFIDVGSPESETAHGYSSTRGEPTGEVESGYEGENRGIVVRDTGRRHAGGEIRFTVAIRPENGGVRLRRRLDQGHGPQRAALFVDGQAAGVWIHSDLNPFLRWFDSDIDLPARLTCGKERLEIRLSVAEGECCGEFNDFHYEIFCFEPRA